jgi:hypothetical protein
MKTIEFFVVVEAWLFLFPDRRPFTCRKTLEKTEGTIKNGQSRETGNIGHRRHRKKTNKTQNTAQKIKNLFWLV